MKNKSKKKNPFDMKYVCYSSFLSKKVLESLIPLRDRFEIKSNYE